VTGPELLTKTLAHIEANPETWYQRHYRCRAGMDFAAHAAELDGGQWCTDDPDGPGSNRLTHRRDDPHEHVWASTVSAHDRASRVLGLDRQQARQLFHPDNDLDDLRRIVGELVASAQDGGQPT
jgi:hypothetical protein